MWIANGRRRWTWTRFPVDDLTGDDGAAAALGAYLDRDAPSDAPWGDDPGELGDVVRDLGAVLMEAMGVRRQRRRQPQDARGGRPGSAATSSGFHGRSTGRRKGAPGVGPPRRVSEQLVRFSECLQGAACVT
jgi:hypothetical protein